MKFKPSYVAFVATSIDGRISLSKKHPPDWTSKEDWKFFQKSLSDFDAVVVGRNTYEAVSKRMKKRNTFVLSRGIKKSFHRGKVNFVNPTFFNLSKSLEIYKKIAIVGGSGVYQYMLDSGLLDEIFITIEPFIFGRGKEMFIGGNKNTKVKLISVKKLNKKGTLLLHYKIEH